ncbi:MAG: hypothetical protein QG635_2356 [Bacteroidota bacterium]|nr:hypothetical protein [Bacteroidota bacterium]
MKRYISFDWAVKKLLRSKANFGILEGFLSELLRKDIKILRLLESESNKDNPFDKYNRVDMLVEDTKGELIIVEVQNSRQMDFLQRLLYGTSKLLIENIDEGIPYSDIKKVISVNIVYFDIGQGEDYLYHGSTRFLGIYKNDELQLSGKQKEAFKVEGIFELFPEYYIIKVNNFNDVAKDTLDEWIYFLKNEDIQTEFKAKGLREAKKKLDIMKLSKEELSIYNRYRDHLHYQASLYQTYMYDAKEALDEKYHRAYETGKINGVIDGEKIGIEKGEKIGIEKGEKIGIEKNMLAIARKMKEEGYTIKDIKKITNLSTDIIKTF